VGVPSCTRRRDRGRYNGGMRIVLACPAPPRSRHGNRVTALRWMRFLRELGHRVTIVSAYDEQPCDLLVALHARRSYPSLARYRRLHPDGPLVVALTGTDLYHDLGRSARARRSLEIADRLILLQPKGREALPAKWRAKARVIYQSVQPTVTIARAASRTFDVCVLGHLRPVKDPFRTALALRLVPKDLPIRVLHAGKALSPAMAKRARALMAREARYHWLGELPRGRARRLLAGCRLLVLSSRLEGGANVISEAVVDGVPVLASRIAGSVGLLGRDYPGYFPVGHTAALAGLLRRSYLVAAYYRRLRRACDRRRPLFEPSRERQSWRDLLGDLAPRS
jgi:putative glycosyltransferase (TIGR04348 family)